MKSIFFLSAATFSWPIGLVKPGPFLSKDRADLSCTVAVCVRDNGDLLLVDAGLSELSESAPEKSLLGATRRFLGLKTSALSPVVRQLESLGFDRGQVKTVVATHCHFDHVGGLCDFPDARLVTTRFELSAVGGFGLQAFYRPADLACSNRIDAVDLGGPRTHCFPSSLDLFGDGEVVLLDAEGHTGGHLAVALRSGDDFFLHVGDAVFQDWETGQGFAGPSRLSRFVCDDDRALRRTIRNLQKLAEAEDSPLVVPSHDMDVFQSLPHAPKKSRKR